MAFEIAARAAFREGIAKAGPQLLEPVMRVEVVTPEEYMGDIIGDLNSRRGQISGMDQRGNAQVINADGAAGQHVRLRQQAALDEPGPGAVTPCISITTSRCRRASRTKSARSMA